LVARSVDCLMFAMLIFRDKKVVGVLCARFSTPLQQGLH
jgi:hypothetical protein